jgi:hypothetical protein
MEKRNKTQEKCEWKYPGILPFKREELVKVLKTIQYFLLLTVTNYQLDNNKSQILKIY